MQKARATNVADYDAAKIDEAVLALLHLNSWTEELGPYSSTLAWKSLSWDSMDRLYAAGFIGDPRTKTGSPVTLTDGGAKRAKAACGRLFGKAG